MCPLPCCCFQQCLGGMHMWVKSCGPRTCLTCGSYTWHVRMSTSMRWSRIVEGLLNKFSSCNILIWSCRAWQYNNKYNTFSLHQYLSCPSNSTSCWLIKLSNKLEYFATCINPYVFPTFWMKKDFVNMYSHFHTIKTIWC